VAGVVLGDAGYESGETFIDNVSVMCRRCNRALAEGAFTVKPSQKETRGRIRRSP